MVYILAFLVGFHGSCDICRFAFASIVLHVYYNGEIVATNEEKKCLGYAEDVLTSNCFLYNIIYRGESCGFYRIVRYKIEVGRVGL